MKKQIKLLSIFLLFVSAGLFSACEDMLDTNSDRILPEEENNLGSPNDTVFSILGILAEVQKLSDRYILLGELRGDLLDVTEHTNSDLREINDLTNIRSDNPYLGIVDYYSVINNCNYFIHNVDTTLKSQGVPLMLKEYGLAKTIRAWAYMQLSLNFGSVPFFLEPVTSLEQSVKNYPKKNIREIAPVLIEDLEPCVGYGLPVYGNIETGWGDWSADYFLFPIRFVLGDLYMWKGESEADFSAAAYHYAMLINEKNILPTAQ